MVIDCTSQPLVSTPNVVLHSVTAQTIATWIELYERNYAWQPSPSDANWKRWIRMFASEPRVDFLLVEWQGCECGTVQLADPDNGCCGVYSLSMPSGHRGVRTLRHIGSELMRLAFDRGCRWLSFDRLRPTARTKEPRGTLALRFRAPLWRVASSETGYRPTASP